MIKSNKRNSSYIAHHAQDMYTDLGYDYRETVFSKTMSNQIFKNENNKNILNVIQHMVVYLIDSVKQIRLQFMISLDKNDRNLN